MPDLGWGQRGYPLSCDYVVIKSSLNGVPLFWVFLSVFFQSKKWRFLKKSTNRHVLGMAFVGLKGRLKPPKLPSGGGLLLVEVWAQQLKIRAGNLWIVKTVTSDISKPINGHNNCPFICILISQVTAAVTVASWCISGERIWLSFESLRMIWWWIMIMNWLQKDGILIFPHMSIGQRTKPFIE